MKDKGLCVMCFTAHSKEDSDRTWARRKLTQQIVEENQTSSTPRAGEWNPEKFSLSYYSPVCLYHISPYLALFPPACEMMQTCALLIVKPPLRLVLLSNGIPNFRTEDSLF